VAKPVPPTAQNNPNSGDQQTDDHTLVVGKNPKFQFIPSEDVITLLLAPPTEQNNPNSGDQHVLVLLKFGQVYDAQFIPSDDIATEVFPYGTAQNNPNSGDQHTEFQLLSGAPVAVIFQLIPFDDVIILVAVPESATAQNNPNSGDQHTECQSLASAADCVTHVIPSLEIITLSLFSI
jgi:hypothetical protein